MNKDTAAKDPVMRKTHISLKTFGNYSIRMTMILKLDNMIRTILKKLDMKGEKREGEWKR